MKTIVYLVACVMAFSVVSAQEAERVPKSALDELRDRVAQLEREKKETKVIEEEPKAKKKKKKVEREPEPPITQLDIILGALREIGGGKGHTPLMGKMLGNDQQFIFVGAWTKMNPKTALSACRRKWEKPFAGLLKHGSWRWTYDLEVKSAFNKLMRGQTDPRFVGGIAFKCYTTSDHPLYTNAETGYDPSKTQYFFYAHTGAYAASIVAENKRRAGEDDEDDDEDAGSGDGVARLAK